jgi:hypothetical protein
MQKFSLKTVEGNFLLSFDFLSSRETVKNSQCLSQILFFTLICCRLSRCVSLREFSFVKRVWAERGERRIKKFIVDIF